GVNAAVGESGKMIRRLIGEDVDLRCELAGEPAWVRADPGHLDQVILNLVVNARDAMPGGGRVTIRTAVVRVGPEEGEARRVGEGGNEPEPGLLAAASGPEPTDPMNPGEYVVLQVSDTGVGMTDEIRRH